MKAFDDMEYHPTTETLVEIISNKTQIADPLYLRVLIGYYFALAATQMRCVIKTPDSGDIPVNVYALNLAPSGFGKTRSCNLIESEVLGQFRNRFLEETFPLMAADNLPRIANRRAARKQTDPDQELERTQREFERTGEMLFSFDSGTAPAVKQMRHKLLMANAGSMNLIMDEVGANLVQNREVFDTFIELYDKGLIKTKLIKNTAESSRSEEILGKTPTNLLMFGVPTNLMNGGQTEDAFMTMLEMGYARRCFFGYARKVERQKDLTPEEIYEMRTNQANETELEALSDRLENLADLINANKKLQIQREVYLKLIEYQRNCEDRAELLSEHQDLRRIELSNRWFKVLKLAGAYAFIDDATEVTEAHLYYAMKLAEDSGRAFEQILSRDKPWVKLAKYLSVHGQDVTHADLAEELAFYKGSQSAKQDMLNLAIAWGYKNNVVIKKSFSDGIEFLRGETLRETDLDQMIVAYSNDMTTGYRNERAPFDQLHKLTQVPGMHWVAHHLVNGYRNEENTIAGFNLAVVDVDGGVAINTVKLLLKDHKFLLYTTKRHTEEEPRFRLIFPTNYELKLDSKDYTEFMRNLFEWLPFEVDLSTPQRARKWLSHDGHYEYNEGEVLDVLPFIPKTSKNEKRKEVLSSQQSMDNLERWMMNNIGDGNRNNMLLRYAMILLDAGADFDGIRQKVIELNGKIPDGLDEAEIMSTIMVTVGRALSSR